MLFVNNLNPKIMETITSPIAMSEALKTALQEEMNARGVNLLHYSFVEEKVISALNDAKVKDAFLRPLGIFPVSSCADTRNFNDRKKEIKSYFSDNYKNWKLARKQEGLPTGNLDIREMQPSKDGTYQTIWNSFGRPLEDMVVTENRILQIMFGEDAESKKIREVLDVKNRWSHFLIAVYVNGTTEFFVVYVYLYLFENGWHFRLDRLDYAHVWNGNFLYRFVAAV